MSSPPGGPPGSDGPTADREQSLGRAEQLRRIAPQLVGLEVWCRQNELGEIAQLLSAAIDVVDRELTGH